MEARARPSVTARDVLDAVATRRASADASLKNVNGALTLECEVWALAGARARVDPNEAVRRASACAMTLMHECASAEEAALAHGAALGAMALARETLGRRATRAAAARAGASRRASACARTMASMLANVGDTIRSPLSGTVFGRYLAGDLKRATEFAEALLEAHGDAKDPRVPMFEGASDDGDGMTVETYLALMAVPCGPVNREWGGAQPVLVARFFAAILALFMRAWFDETSNKMSTRPTQRDIRNARHILFNINYVLSEYYFAIDDEHTEADWASFAHALRPTWEFLHFLALDDNIDDYFDESIVGKFTFHQVIRLFVSLNYDVMVRYSTLEPVDVSGDFASSLTRIMEIIELFTADTNAFKDVQSVVQNELYNVLTLPEDEFSRRWLPLGDVGSRVLRLLGSDAKRTTPMLALYQIIGNLHDAENHVEQSEFSRRLKQHKNYSKDACLAKLMRLGVALDAASAIKQPTTEESENYDRFVSAIAAA